MGFFAKGGGGGEWRSLVFGCFSLIELYKINNLDVKKCDIFQMFVRSPQSLILTGVS